MVALRQIFWSIHRLTPNPPLIRVPLPLWCHSPTGWVWPFPHQLLFYFSGRGAFSETWASTFDVLAKIDWDSSCSQQLKGTQPEHLVLLFYWMYANYCCRLKSVIDSAILCWQSDSLALTKAGFYHHNTFMQDCRRVSSPEMSSALSSVSPQKDSIGLKPGNGRKACEKSGGKG